MLQTIRKHIKGWVAGIITALIALTFIFFGVQSYEHSGNQNQVVAKVGSSKITASEVDQLFQQWKNSQENQYKRPLSNLQQQQLHAMALQQLINTNALYNAAIKGGFQVSLEQIKQMVMQEPEFQQDGRFSEQKFLQILTANQITPDQFFSQMQQSLTTRQVFDGLQSSTFVLRNEMAQIFALVKQTRSIGYFILSGSSATPAVEQNTVPVPEKNITEYYQQHKDEFKTPEQVKVAYLLLSPQDISKTVTINPAQVKEYYQDHLANYATKPGVYKDFASVKTDIENLLVHQRVDRILNNRTQKLSELTYTNPNTLSVAADQLKLPIRTSDWISRDHQEKLFAEPKLLTAIFSADVLQQGNNSDPIEMNDGSVIVVRIAQHQSSIIQPLAMVKSQIANILQKQIAQKKIGLKAFEIQKALQDGAAPDVLAKQYNLKWQNELDSLRNSKRLPKPILSAAFNLTPTSKQPHPVTTTLLKDGDYAIIQLQEVKLGHYNTASASDTDHLRTTLINYWGQIDYQLYMLSVMAHTKVSYTQPQSTNEQ